MLPAITVDPKVDTQVVYYDSPLAARERGVDLREEYEDNKAILFEDAGLGITAEDWAFLDNINLPKINDNTYKKAKITQLVAPITDYSKHVLSGLFKNDRTTAERYRALVIAVTARVRKHVEGLFPGYRITDDSSITWRITLTDNEEIHYDSYGTSTSESHHVRVFVNLDSKPRLWGIGPVVDGTIKTYAERLAKHPVAHPNLFNATLNSVLPWHKIPRHYAAFVRNNMWMVNSQSVAHEAIFGRKLLACTYMCDPASIKDQSKSFQNLVRRTLKEIGR